MSHRSTVHAALRLASCQSTLQSNRCVFKPVNFAMFARMHSTTSQEVNFNADIPFNDSPSLSAAPYPPPLDTGFPRQEQVVCWVCSRCTWLALWEGMNGLEGTTLLGWAPFILRHDCLLHLSHDLWLAGQDWLQSQGLPVRMVQAIHALGVLEEPARKLGRRCPSFGHDGGANSDASVGCVGRVRPRGLCYHYARPG